MSDRPSHNEDNTGPFNERLHDNGDGTFSKVVGAILIDPTTGLGYTPSGGGGGGSVPTGTAGSANASVVTVQGIAGATAIPVSDSATVTTATNTGNTATSAAAIATAAGAPADAAYAGSGGPSIIAALKGLYNQLVSTVSQVTLSATAAGTPADSAYAGSGSASIVAALKGLYVQMCATAAGTSNTIAQAVQGVTNGVPLAATIPTPTILTGSAYSAINTDLITGTVNGWYASGANREAVVQIIASAGISAGVLTFEQTNDTTNAPAGNPAYFTQQASVAGPSSNLTPAASTTYVCRLKLECAYFRVRISTAIVGGTVQATTLLSISPGHQDSISLQTTSTTSSIVGTVLVGNTANTTPILANPSAVATSGGLATTARLLSAAATTNSTLVKASAGRLYKIIGYNAAAAVRYLKIYNKATAPTVGTDTPVKTIAIGPSQAFNIDFGTLGYYFATGIGYGISTGSADSDTGALTAADIVGMDITYM